MTSATAPWWVVILAAVIGGLLTQFGVVIKGLIDARLQRKQLAHDDRVRHDEQDREGRAIRSIVFALLADLKMLTSIAKRTAEFDPARWRVAVGRLVHRADQLETATALGDNNLIFVVLEAAFDVERRLQVIEQLQPPQIEDAPKGPPAELWLRAHRIDYLNQVRGHSRVADFSVGRALEMLGGSGGPPEPEPSTDELLEQHFGRDAETSGVSDAGAAANAPRRGQ